MDISLTHEQPPRLQVTCDDGNEYRALSSAVNVLARQSENFEVSQLEPNPSSELVQGLKRNMASTTKGDKEVVFFTSVSQQRTLHAAATVALNALETRLDATSEAGLLAGCTNEAPMQANVRSNGLMAGIQAWKTRKKVLGAPAKHLPVAVTAN